MWRAFFFAIGTMLIILGLECLVTEHFIVSQGRVSKVLAKILDDKPANSNQTIATAQLPMVGQSPLSTSRIGAGNGFGPNAGLPFRGNPPVQTSRYGPSRFNDSFAGQQPQNFYGGTPYSARAANSPFSLAGFGDNNVVPTVPIQQIQTSQDLLRPLERPRRTQMLTPKDWMPWSLLAAGSLVVLYTNSTSRRSYSGE